jgi:serine/threonine-protein kinase ATR
LKAHQALRLLASLNSSVAAKKTEVVEYFFETNVLGIIKDFADTINEVQVRQPLTEKKRCLKATAAMVKLGKGKITSALPQVCINIHFKSHSINSRRFQPAFGQP